MGIVAGLCIGLMYLTKEGNKARDDANRLYDEVCGLREQVAWYEARDSLTNIEKEADWNALIEALIIIETEGEENPELAAGDQGRAVGVLQIRPDVVEDVQIAGYDYTLSDRLSREKSIEMWKAWQSIYNPCRDINYAIKRHNPRLSMRTHDRILRLIEMIKERE
jgi:hypothetical protein